MAGCAFAALARRLDLRVRLPRSAGSLVGPPPRVLGFCAEPGRRGLCTSEALLGHSCCLASFNERADSLLFRESVLAISIGCRHARTRGGGAPSAQWGEGFQCIKAGPSRLSLHAASAEPIMVLGWPEGERSERCPHALHHGRGQRMPARLRGTRGRQDRLLQSGAQRAVGLVQDLAARTTQKEPVCLYHLISCVEQRLDEARLAPGDEVHRPDRDSRSREGLHFLRARVPARRQFLCHRVPPDGSLLYSFATKGLKPGFLRGAGFGAYHAVSKVPWLFALAAWYEGSTWTRGFHFVEGPKTKRPWDIGEEEHGDARPLRMRYGLAATSGLQYAAERRRGWVEHEWFRRPVAWEECRSILAKPSPAGGRRLVMEDRGVQASGIEGLTPAYFIEERGELWNLDAAWADWDHEGRLLIATPDARLQLRDPETPNRVLREHDLSSLRPNPQPAPDWAHRW